MMKTTDANKTFRQVYADAVIPDMTEEQWQKASNERSLSWMGERMPLKEAADLFAHLPEGYNDFDPVVLKQLDATFLDRGIEATPARESSPAIYLHVPEGFQQDVERWVREHFKADEVNWRPDGSLRIWWD